jgi:uncharacterized protein YndB with AHSA1/START domain
MPDILQDFPIRVSGQRVFDAVSQPDELAQWWTARSAGQPRIGNEYVLWFGPEYDWRAVVTRCKPGKEFEFEMTRADTEWTGTRVGFRLQETNGGTQVGFYHRGWPAETAHFRVSSHCWAMYLRLLRRYLEHGETVAYELRLDA